jgi:hypothetical protein
VQQLYFLLILPSLPNGFKTATLALSPVSIVPAEITTVSVLLLSSKTIVYFENQQH